MGKFLIVLVSISIYISLSVGVEGQIEYVSRGCVDTGINYNKSSKFETNLNRVLSTLTEKSSSVVFYNSTAGDAGDKVYGLFQCRYDLSPNICAKCVKDATKKIIDECPYSREAIVWYYECSLRYANRNIFNLYETSVSVTSPSSKNVSNIEGFMSMLWNTLNEVVKYASSKAPYFSSVETYNSTIGIQLYSFAQCTADLDRFGCDSCLKKAISKIVGCCSGKTGVVVFFPSCQLRYDTNGSFLNDTSTNMVGSVMKKKGTVSKVLIAAIVVCALLALVGLAVVMWLCLCFKKLKNSTSNVSIVSAKEIYDDTVNIGDVEGVGDNECVQHDFATPKDATRDFSNENELDEGTFAKNAVENYANKTMETLSDNEQRLRIEDRIKIKDEIKNALEWLNRNNDLKDAPEYEKKLKELQDYYGSIIASSSKSFVEGFGNIVDPPFHNPNSQNEMIISGDESTTREEVTNDSETLTGKAQKAVSEEEEEVEAVRKEFETGMIILGDGSTRDEVTYNSEKIPEKIQKSAQEEVEAVRKEFKEKIAEMEDKFSALVNAHGLGSSSNVKRDVDNIGEPEFKQYDFATLRIATKDFSAENKLGKGGFGTVYKGTLVNGEILAIKRLSATGGQGTKEFMTEARLLAKLQHRNLIKLTGFCLEGEEKLLVYEFMPNSSLDGFLFDSIKRQGLDWTVLRKIVLGIARGLQYLHEDSRLTIIHRDLKPANILLDNEMNAKITDFGVAKLFEDAQKFANTDHIVGTQGYMAPEYKLTGEYSGKTDVYSFGIMLLEIVSGRRNLLHSHSPQREDLSVQAWRLWNKGQSFEITGSMLLNDCSRNDVIRCIQIGLLCVQKNAKKRPTMSEVVLMLTAHVNLPVPTAPDMQIFYLSI